jgi:hypothetical protein
MKARWARLAAGVLGSAIIATFAFACRKNPNVSFEVDYPSDVSGTAVFVEVGAYPGASCSTLTPQAIGGLPQGYASRIAFRLDDKVRPSMGDLPKKQYAFVGTARDQNCGVVAYGCVSSDVGGTSSVVLNLQDTQSTLGTCSADAVCQDAVCVTSPDKTNPSLGTGCSLQMIGSGPLGQRILDGDSFADETIGSPGVVATPTGFLVAYREVEQLTGNARITTMSIDPGGGSPGPSSAGIVRCENDDENDGIGVALSGSLGLVGVSRHPCPGKTGGIDYIGLDSMGNLGTKVATVYNTNQPMDFVTMSYGKSMAPATSGVYDVTYIEDGQALFAQTTVSRIDVPPTENAKRAPLLSSGALETHVASSDKLVAFLTRSNGTSGGGESGDASSMVSMEGGGGGGGGGGSTLHLQITTPDATPDTFTTPDATDIPGVWGSLAASGENVAVLTNGADNPLQLYVFNQNRTMLANAGIPMNAPDPVLYADIAYVNNRILIAAARPGTISLLAFTSAADAGGQLPEIVLDADPRVPDLRSYRDGHIAIAASTNRVIVVWTIATALTGSDATGGYALFACAD